MRSNRRWKRRSSPPCAAWPSRRLLPPNTASPADQPVLLFAMGDGNHSLATAKAIWEKIKPTVGLDHPARYALVEIENVHDEALEFEPIHRVLFGLKQDFLAAS